MEMNYPRSLPSNFYHNVRFGLGLAGRDRLAHVEAN